MLGVISRHRLLPKMNDNEKDESLAECSPTATSLQSPTIIAATEKSAAIPADSSACQAICSQHRNNLTIAIDIEVEEEDEKDIDGGYAWVITICLMLTTFAAWGWTAGFGVFLAYFLSANYFPGATAIDYALVGSLAIGLGQLSSPLAALSYKLFGPYWTTIIGIVLQTSGLILGSFATEIWQLYFTLSFLAGGAILFISLPGAFTLPSWFRKKKATAMGILQGGAGLGGVFFSLVVQKLINDTGNHKWALRMCALVNFVVAGSACCFLRPRIYKPIPFKKAVSKQFVWENVRDVFSLEQFTSNYCLVVLGLWYGLSLLGYILVIFTVSPFGILRGLTPKQSSILTAVLSSSQVIGRPTSGTIADIVGRYNFVTINGLVVSVLIWGYWLSASSFGSLLGFSILIGFSHGMGAMFCQPLASDLLNDVEKITSTWSTLNIVVLAFCISSEVIAISLRDYKLPNPYIKSQIFGGACYFGCALCTLVIRERMVNKTIRSKIEVLEEEKLDGSDLDQLERLNRVYEMRFGLGYLYRMFYPIKV